jgi:hypothetical protein
VAATYDNTLATTKDKIRFRMGDTDTVDALLQDEEIAAALNLTATEDAAVAFLANGLIQRYSRDPIKVTADGVTMDFSAKIEAWQRMVTEADELVTQGVQIRRLARPTLISDRGEYTTK